MRTKSINLTELQLSELESRRKSKECTANELKRITAILLVDASSCKLIKPLTGFSYKYAFGRYSRDWGPYR